MYMERRRWYCPPTTTTKDECDSQESESYFCKIENFAYREINMQTFRNSHPKALRGPKLRTLGLLVKFYRRAQWTLKIASICDVFIWGDPESWLGALKNSHNGGDPGLMGTLSP